MNLAVFILMTSFLVRSISAQMPMGRPIRAPGEMGRMVEERKEVLDRHVKDLDFLKIKITISRDNLKNALNQYRQ